MTTPTPSELWQQSGENGDEYRRLMREHGHMVPLKPGETAQPLPCGWPTRRVADSPEVDAIQARGRRLLAVGKRAIELLAEHPDWRDGQCAFSALEEIEPGCADIVRHMAVDPFYDDAKLDAFWDFVGEWTAE